MLDPVNMNLKLILVLLVAFSPRPLCVQVGQTNQDLSVSLKDLRNAPAVVMLNNRALHLSAYPWRDFAPGGLNANGSPLMVALKLTSEDKQPLPSGIRLERAWVLWGEQVWEVSNLRGGKAGQSEDNETWIKCSNSPVCEITVRGGPKWGPGVYVDAVVRFTDSEGKQYLLQASQQYVVHTV